MDEDNPKYTLSAVEQTMLIEVIEQHPRHLMVCELVARIVSNPEDEREVETATEAILSLKRSALIRYNDDAPVEPTPAALHAHALLA